MRSAPVIPAAPPAYDARAFEEVFRALRTYFYALDNPDVLRPGRLFLLALANTEPPRANEVWVDGEGVLRLSGAGTGTAVENPVFFEGTPSASQLRQWVAVRACTFPVDMVGSIGRAGVAATAQTDFDLQKNGVSFGTMRFAASGTSASFIAASATSFAAGDVLSVVAPGTPDATLANIAATLLGYRS